MTSEDSDIENEDEEFEAERTKYDMPVYRQPLHDDIDENDNRDVEEEQEEEAAVTTWIEGTTAPAIFFFHGGKWAAGTNGRRDTP
ncbi:hypothetical protein PoB_003454800 [Plakobranchus ocellatus]|uniref:Alpha/beta hydrolase fold-3 domain-containing protein n=1 Tax=Plakobranchus ocellatus TaxID=259542 RepID=A0AAV4AMM8_9GAST|nr:hypothetical protein PoB_003454800 [Plakobranchus ocellatus]